MPKIVTKRYTLYAFRELDEAVQLKIAKTERDARYTERDAQRDSVFREIVTESVKEKLADMGLPTKEVVWKYTARAFYSRGDGLSFFGEFDIKKIARASNIRLPDEILEDLITAVIKNDHGTSYHSCGPKTMKVQLVCDPRPSDESGMSRLCDKLEEYIEEVSVRLFKELQDEYDYHFSEKSVYESLYKDEKNLYLADGSLANHLNDEAA